MDCKEIKTVVIDADGVLTDGKIFFTHKAEMFKGFHTRDIRSIRQLIAYGYEVVILTASNWPGMSSFIEKTGADVCITKNKTQIIKQLHGGFIYVGDDVWDLAIMMMADIAVAPADCDDQLLLTIPKLVILNKKGGEGVLSELIRLMFEGEQ